MEEFISYAKLVIGALGYKIFEPLVTKKSDEPELELADSPEPVLYCNRRGAQAKGQRTAEGFALLAGSRISPDFLKSAPASVIKSREKYKDALSADGVVNKDLLFATPSGAAGFVIGGSANGYFEWKTAEGQTLKDWEG